MVLYLYTVTTASVQADEQRSEHRATLQVQVYHDIGSENRSFVSKRKLRQKIIGSPSSDLNEMTMTDEAWRQPGRALRAKCEDTLNLELSSECPVEDYLEVANEVRHTTREAFLLHLTILLDYSHPFYRFCNIFSIIP